MSKVKKYIFIAWWLLKNRNWKDTRQKWKALDKELAKRERAWH